MAIPSELQKGADWFRRLIWVQAGIPVELRLNNVTAVLKNSDSTISIDADDIIWGEYTGVIDVYFHNENRPDIPLGTYILQVSLEYLDGYNQSPLCIPVNVVDCTVTKTVTTPSWG